MAGQTHGAAPVPGEGSGPAHTEAMRHVLEVTRLSVPDGRVAIISRLEG